LQVELFFGRIGFSSFFFDELGEFFRRQETIM
jgi:hypothetical protein